MIFVGWGFYWHSVRQKGGVGVVGGGTEMLGWEKIWELERGFCQRLNMQFQFEHIGPSVGLLRGSAVGCTDKTSSKLPSWQFSLLCQKWENRENHVGASIGFALGGSIISTNLKQISRIVFQNFELTRQNLSSRCDLCQPLQTLCWTLWGNSFWETFNETFTNSYRVIFLVYSERNCLWINGVPWWNEFTLTRPNLNFFMWPNLEVTPSPPPAEIYEAKIEIWKLVILTYFIPWSTKSSVTITEGLRTNWIFKDQEQNL